MRCSPNKLQIRVFVRKHQAGRCLVCSFPLELRGHLHHIIANDIKGPYHPLNLIGLCPNHHAALEDVYRHLAPREARSRPGFLRKGLAAQSFIKALDADGRRLFDYLSEPHPLREPIRDRDQLSPTLRTILARQIAQKDSEILLAINATRPAALLAWRIKDGRIDMPHDEESCQVAVENIKGSLCARDVAEVVSLHLQALELPFDRTWLEVTVTGSGYELEI